MLRWIDGFESYGTSGDASGLARKYASVTGPTFWDIDTGRLGGYALKGTGYSAIDCRSKALTTDATMIVGFALKVAGTEYPNAWKLISLYDTVEGVNVYVSALGELVVYCGVTLLGSSPVAALPLNNWVYVELKVLCNAVTGTYELRVNGTAVVSGSGDTKAGANDYHQAFAIWHCGSGVTPTYYDDLYVADGSGTVNNDFLGNHKVVALVPNGAGDSSQWTPSAGGNYACVDENPSNGDTDYVEDGTAGHRDLFACSDVSDLGIIRGVQVSTICRETDVNPFTLKTVVKSGSTVDADAGQPIGSTDYVARTRILETDPATDAAWTQSGVNGMQIGIEVA